MNNQINLTYNKEPASDNIIYKKKNLKLGEMFMVSSKEHKKKIKKKQKKKIKKKLKH